MAHFVYILKSQTTGKYYCGETQDVEDRLERHNSGRSKSTKSGSPWELVQLLEIENRSEARKLESKIKRIGIERWMKR